MTLVSVIVIDQSLNASGPLRLIHVSHQRVEFKPERASTVPSASRLPEINMIDEGLKG